MSKSTPKDTSRIRNKKARHRFEVLQTVECGLSLAGSEVKSLRAGQASLDEAFARIRGNEVWLLGMHIAPYSHAGNAGHIPTRARKLLLHRREIEKWTAKVTQQGLTLVPLEVYFNARGLAKVQLALVRGKSHHDKRQDLKKREHQREIARVVRRGG